MEHTDRLSVSLLGNFALEHHVGAEKYVLTEQDHASRRLWAFLQYLTAFNARPVSQSELIEALWGDEDGSSNPGNALKTLLHRARNLMEQLGFEDGKKVILYRRGFYVWNPELRLHLDIDLFDQLCEQSSPSNLQPALEAIELYQGDFLPNAAGSPWAVSMRTYYHTKYLALCSDTAASLYQQEQYESAAKICRQATVIDPYDEASHLMLMRSLNASGAQQAAIQHYSRVADMFMDQLGVVPSEEMVQLYRELTKAEMQVELDLYTVRQKLEEKGSSCGAYFCELITFQDIYQLEARNVQRNGQVVQLVMLTLTDRRGEALDSRQCAVALDELRHVIQRCLRSGDAFTRFSASQYLILLPTATYETGTKVIQRIINTYSQTLMGKISSLRYSLLPVLPASDGTFKVTPLSNG